MTLEQDHLIHISGVSSANLKCFTSIIYKFVDENEEPTWTWNKLRIQTINNLASIRTKCSNISLTKRVSQDTEQIYALHIAI